MRIAFASDHLVFREAVTQALADGLAPEVEMIPAGDMQTAAEQLAATEANLMLVDLRTPGVTQGAELKALRRRHPAMPVVVLSGSGHRNDVLRYVRLGVDGYIPASHSSAAMLSALRLVLSGESYFPSTAVTEREAAAADGRTAALSTGEDDVLRLLMDGRTNKAIARALGVQEITVKKRLSRVYRKLGVNNRVEAVRAVLNDPGREH